MFGLAGWNSINVWFGWLEHLDQCLVWQAGTREFMFGLAGYKWITVWFGWLEHVDQCLVWMAGTP